MCIYVSEICDEGIFITFPWCLKNVKIRSKIALFSNERHFEIWFPKLKTVTFFWSKLSKLHKKDPILHVATTFSLKQGETRTSHGPIPPPLSIKLCTIMLCCTPIRWTFTVFGPLLTELRLNQCVILYNQCVNGILNSNTSRNTFMQSSIEWKGKTNKQTNKNKNKNIKPFWTCWNCINNFRLFS